MLFLFLFLFLAILPFFLASLGASNFPNSNDKEISEKFEFVLEMDGITNDDISEIFLMLSSKFDSTSSAAAMPMNDELKDFAAENKVSILFPDPRQNSYVCLLDNFLLSDPLIISVPRPTPK